MAVEGFRRSASPVYCRLHALVQCMPEVPEAAWYLMLVACPGGISFCNTKADAAACHCRHHISMEHRQYPISNHSKADGSIPHNSTAHANNSHNSNTSSTTTSSSSSRDTPAVVQQQQMPWVPHPPPLILGNSPSGSSSNLAGSQAGPSRAGSLQHQGSARGGVLSPDGRERPFVIGVAGGTGEL